MLSTSEEPIAKYTYFIRLLYTPNVIGQLFEQPPRAQPLGSMRWPNHEIAMTLVGNGAVSIITASIIVCVASPCYATAAPDNLRNKSFTVTWTETHDRREGGGNEFRQMSLSMQMSLYVSSAGRPFSKLIVGGGRGASASQGSVGQSGTSLGSGSRVVSFIGSGILITSNFGGAARRITINGSGSACSAEVHVAKLAGASTVAFKRTDGRTFELHSLSASSASCQSSEGNTFAN
jgi:hypothetical protein